MEENQEIVASLFSEHGLLPRGWKEDRLLQRCLAWRGGTMFYLSVPL